MTLIRNPDGTLVNVPDRYLDQYIQNTRASYVKQDLPPAVKKSEIQAGENYVRYKNRIVKESDLPYSVRVGFRKSVNPLQLYEMGIRPSDENISFRSKNTAGKQKEKADQFYKQQYEKYYLTGNPVYLSNILEQKLATEGPRAAFKERERMIDSGIKHTSLTGAYGGGIPGKPSTRTTAENKALFEKGQKALEQERQIVKGTLGATFDQRFPVINKPTQTETKYEVTINGKKRVFNSEAAANEFIKRYENTQYLGTTQGQAIQGPVKPEIVQTPLTPLDLYKPKETQFNKALEKSYNVLDEIQKDKKINWLVGAPLEVAKQGLGVAASIVNLTEKYVDPYITGKKFQTTKPIELKGPTADQTVFPYKFEENRFKNPLEIGKESLDYIKTYGAGSFVSGNYVAYGLGAEAAVKQVSSKITLIGDVAKTKAIAKQLVTNQPFEIRRIGQRTFEIASGTEERTSKLSNVFKTFKIGPKGEKIKTNEIITGIGPKGEKIKIKSPDVIIPKEQKNQVFAITRFGKDAGLKKAEVIEFKPTQGATEGKFSEYILSGTIEPKLQKSVGAVPQTKGLYKGKTNEEIVKQLQKAEAVKQIETTAIGKRVTIKQARGDPLKDLLPAVKKDDNIRIIETYSKGFERSIPDKPGIGSLGFERKLSEVGLSGTEKKFYVPVTQEGKTFAVDEKFVNTLTGKTKVKPYEAAESKINKPGRNLLLSPQTKKIISQSYQSEIKQPKPQDILLSSPRQLPYYQSSIDNVIVRYPPAQEKTLSFSKSKITQIPLTSERQGTLIRTFQGQGEKLRNKMKTVLESQTATKQSYKVIQKQPQREKERALLKLYTPLREKEKGIVIPEYKPQLREKVTTIPKLIIDSPQKTTTIQEYKIPELTIKKPPPELTTRKKIPPALAIFSKPQKKKKKGKKGDNVDYLGFTYEGSVFGVRSTGDFVYGSKKVQRESKKGESQLLRLTGRGKAPRTTRRKEAPDSNRQLLKLSGKKRKIKL